MPPDSLPMLRVVRRGGQVQEIVVGPSAGKLVVRSLLIVAGSVLLIAGVIRWDDIASTATMLKLW